MKEIFFIMSSFYKLSERCCTN